MTRIGEQIEDPSLCVVRLGQGERVSTQLADLLNPVDPSTLHVYRLEAKCPVELHYHDIDEYWYFIDGRPHVTLRSPKGSVRQFDLGPGDMLPVCAA